MPWLSELIALFRSVPDAAWGVFATWVTVALTEGRNSKRARDQREHDAIEKDKERTMTLRQEIYLPVATDLTSVMSFLGAMPSYSIDEIAKSDPLRRYSAAAAKLALVATPSTALAVHRLSTETGALYLNVMALAMSIAERRSLLDVVDNLRETQLDEMARINADLAAIQESGIRDDVRFNALQMRYQSVQRVFDSQGHDRDEMARLQDEAFREYGQKLLPQMRMLLDVSISVLVALRWDLGQAGDAAEFEREMRRQSQRVYAEAEAALRSG